MKSIETETAMQENPFQSEMTEVLKSSDCSENKKHGSENCSFKDKQILKRVRK